MTMDPVEVRALLPCYVCGDLPEEVAAEVRARLDESPALAAEAARLRSAQDACRALLLDAAADPPAVDPALDRALDEDAAAAPTGRERAGPLHGWLALLAAAAGLILVIGGAGAIAHHPPVDGLLAQHEPFARHAVDGFIDESDPAALSAALVEAGATPSLAMVADLRPFGLQLVGGGLAAGDRLGTVVVYEGDGQRYVCQMYNGQAPRDMPVATRSVDGRVLRAYRDGDLAVVVWRELGMVCLFSGHGPVDQLLSMVEAKLHSHA